MEKVKHERTQLQPALKLTIPKNSRFLESAKVLDKGGIGEPSQCISGSPTDPVQHLKNPIPNGKGDAVPESKATKPIGRKPQIQTQKSQKAQKVAPVKKNDNKGINPSPQVSDGFNAQSERPKPGPSVISPVFISPTKRVRQQSEASIKKSPKKVQTESKPNERSNDQLDTVIVHEETKLPEIQEDLETIPCISVISVKPNSRVKILAKSQSTPVIKNQGHVIKAAPKKQTKMSDFVGKQTKMSDFVGKQTKMSDFGRKQTNFVGKQETDDQPKTPPNSPRKRNDSSTSETPKENPFVPAKIHHITTPEPEKPVRKAKAVVSVRDFAVVRKSQRHEDKLKKVKEMEEEESNLHKTILSGVDNPKIEIRMFPGKGRGLVANSHFKKNEFVVEYAGDLLTVAEADKREMVYAAEPQKYGCYMYFFKHKDQSFCVDATAETPRYGRLLNHSRSAANLRTEIIEIADRPYLILRAMRDIKQDEELLYDYGERRAAQIATFPWLKD